MVVVLSVIISLVGSHWSAGTDLRRSVALSDGLIMVQQSFLTDEQERHVRVWVFNFCHAPLSYSSLSNGKNFDVTVVDGGGRIVSYTLFGVQNCAVAANSWPKLHSLGPFQSVSAEYSLQECFNITDGGVYSTLVNADFDAGIKFGSVKLSSYIEAVEIKINQKKTEERK